MRPLLVGAACLIATAAAADPCTAPVTGYRAGDTFAGSVRYVGDGDSICIGRVADPGTWIEVRLADFYAPELSAPGGKEAKAAMQRIALGRQAICQVERGQGGRTFSHDRVIGVCRIGGRSLGLQMKQAGVAEGGNGRR